jgi:hypothetical protein
LRVNEAEAKPPRGPRGPGGFSDDGGGRGYDKPKRYPKPKGSRKNARARKRGF